MVTMGLSRTVSKCHGDICRKKIYQILTPPAFNAPVAGLALEFFNAV